MLHFYSVIILLFICNFSNGQLQIQKINDSCYFEIKKINPKKYQITKIQNNIKIYQTIIKDTSKLKILDYYPMNENYYDNNPLIIDYLIFLYKNGKISKNISFKRRNKYTYRQRAIQKYDTSGILIHNEFILQKRIGLNRFIYSDYKNGNLIYEEKSSYYNFKYRKKYFKKANIIDSLKNKYTLVKNCWSNYPTYQMNNSNIYFIQDMSWKVKLTKTEIKNEYILTHYTEFNKKYLIQKFIQINKKKQTFRNDDQLWSYLKNSIDTFFNDSLEVDYIQRFSKNGNLIFQKKYNNREQKLNNDLVFIKKTSDSLIISHTNSKNIVIKKHKHYIIKYFLNDSIIYETKYYKKSTEHTIYKNGVIVSTEIFDAYKHVYILLNNYFKDTKIIDLEDLF